MPARTPPAPNSSRRRCCRATRRPCGRGEQPVHGQSDSPHQIVYPLNQADEAHQEAIVNAISALLKKYVDDVAQAYGVEFIACGNTMRTVGWTDADMLPFAKVEAVGAAAVMELQEKGDTYWAW